MTTLCDQHVLFHPDNNHARSNSTKCMHMEATEMFIKRRRLIMHEGYVIITYHLKLFILLACRLRLLI